MTDATNGALAEDADFTEEEMAILNGQEPEGDEGAEDGHDGAQEAEDGDEQDAGVEQPAAQQPATETTAEQERQRTVPHQALHEERERRRSIEARLNEEATQRARVEERLNILLQYAQSQNEAAEQANQPQMPDPNEDPIGYQNAMLQQLQQRILQNEQQQSQFYQQYQGQAEQQQRAQQLQQMREQLWQTYTNDANQFSAEQPDFNNAADYLRDVRSKELQAMGFAPAQIEQQIGADYEQFVAMAYQNNRRPAQALYELAKARGYQQGASEQQQAAASSAAAQQGGQQQRQATPGQKLQNIAKGQSVNKSLSGSGSGSPQPLDAKAVANMDDQDFEAFMATMNDKKWEKMLG